MPSLALLFYLLEAVSSGCNRTGVNLKSAEMAADWCGFLEDHAKKVYAGATAPDIQSARALANKIRSGKVKDGHVVRKVYRHHWVMLNTLECVEAGLSVLEDCNWVRIERVNTGGRASDVILLHPELKKD